MGHRGYRRKQACLVSLASGLRGGVRSVYRTASLVGADCTRCTYLPVALSLVAAGSSCVRLNRLEPAIDESTAYYVKRLLNWCNWPVSAIRDRPLSSRH